VTRGEAAATKPFDRLRRELSASTAELFEAVGQGPCVLAPADPSCLSADVVAAVIVFATAAGRGSVLLVAAPDIALRLAGAGADCPYDVVGEFCNMLVGRLKNRLARGGVGLVCTLPALSDGSRVELDAQSTSAADEVWIASGRLVVRLDATLDDDFRLEGLKDREDRENLENLENLANEDLENDAARSASDFLREGDCLLF
jgi:hypothetical protein